MTTTQYRWSPDARLLASNNGQWILKNFANAVTLKLDETQGRILTAVAGLTIPFELPSKFEKSLTQALLRYAFIIPCTDFERYNASTIRRISNQLMKSTGFIIMPTEKCNFKCTYCYESFERGRMTDTAADSVDSLVKLTARAASQFSLGFFGGEPLMCSDLVIRFSKTAFEEMSSRNLPYFAGIATNGY